MPSDASLLREWDALACELGAPRSVPACTLAWYRHLLDDVDDARLVVVRAQGSVVGIWPLHLTRTRRGLVRYRMAGHQSIVGMEPLVARGQPAVREALVVGLMDLRPVADVVELECVGADHDWPSRLADGLGPWRPVLRTEPSSAPWFDLNRYAEWTERRAPRGGKQARRFARRLGELGHHPHVETDVAGISRGLPSLREHYLGRKAARGGWGARYDGAVEAMVAEIVAELAPQGRAALFVYGDGTDVLAVDLVLRAGATVTVWMGGVGTQLLQYSPGQLNLLEVMSWAHVAGAQVLDLGPGVELYKERFSTDARAVVQTELRRRSIWPVNTPYALVPSGAVRLVRRARAAVRRRGHR